MGIPNSDQLPLAPVIGAAGALAPQRITDTSSASHSTAMVPGMFATLINSADTNIAIRFGASTPTAVVTDVELAKGGRFDWYVQEDSKFVAIIAADGAATFECWVWQSSP